MEMHVLHDYDPNPWREELSDRELYACAPESEWKWLCAVAPNGDASIALRLDLPSFSHHLEFDTVLAECSLASLIVLVTKIREVDPTLFVGTPLAVPPSGER